ncbi:MAG: hypothetical protein M3173_00390 [Chloroflexota bacterium]|nr:hypothetical protein [Chloroflexota bacterium]
MRGRLGTWFVPVVLAALVSGSALPARAGIDAAPVASADSFVMAPHGMFACAIAEGRSERYCIAAYEQGGAVDLAIGVVNMFELVPSETVVHRVVTGSDALRPAPGSPMSRIRLVANVPGIGDVDVTLGGWNGDTSMVLASSCPGFPLVVNAVSSGVGIYPYTRGLVGTIAGSPVEIWDSACSSMFLTPSTGEWTMSLY